MLKTVEIIKEIHPGRIILTVADVAKLLRLNAAWLRVRIQDGSLAIPSHRIGRKIVFRIQDVADAIDRGGEVVRKGRPQIKKRQRGRPPKSEAMGG